MSVHCIYMYWYGGRDERVGKITTRPPSNDYANFSQLLPSFSLIWRREYNTFVNIVEDTTSFTVIMRLALNLEVYRGP